LPRAAETGPPLPRSYWQTQEEPMAEDKHDKALDLTEAALDALDSGDEKKADKLIDQAKKLDPSAVKEVVDDLEEAEHSSVSPSGDK
jgi:hypothetical protein